MNDTLPKPIVTWTEIDVAVVALEMSREFQQLHPREIARAIAQAAIHMDPAKGRSGFASLARQFLQFPSPLQGSA